METRRHRFLITRCHARATYGPAESTAYFAEMPPGRKTSHACSGSASRSRTLYWFQHEPCWFVRKKNAPWYRKAGENSTIWASPSPKFIMGGSDEEKYDHPTQKPVELMRMVEMWSPDSADAGRGRAY